MNLLFRICDESVQCNDNRNTVFLKVLNMLLKVDNTFLQCFKIWYGCLCLRNATVVFQGTNCSNQDNSIRFQTSHTTFDIEEFLSTEISTKTGFCYNDICHLKCKLCCTHTIAAMSDIGKWSAVDDGRCMFQGLDQIRLQRILQECCHSTNRIQISGCNRFAGTVVSNNNLCQTVLQIFHIICQAKNSHDLRGNRDDKVIFTYNPIHLVAKADNNISENTIIHIETSFPDNLSGIDIQCIALLDVIVHHCCQKIVGRCNGMKITCKMQVQVFHWYNLCVTAAGSTAFNAEARTERRLS